MKKAAACILLISLFAGLAPSLAAAAVTQGHSPHLTSHKNSRKKYLKQQKKAQRKTRKSQKKIQKKLNKLHHSSRA